MNTTALALYRNTTGSTYVKIGYTTDASVEYSHSPRETTNKDSAGWQEFCEGVRGGTYTATFFYEDGATEGLNEWIDVLDGADRGAEKVRFSTEASGEMYVEGDSYITSISWNSPGAEDTVSCTVSGTFTAAITKATHV